MSFQCQICERLTITVFKVSVRANLCIDFCDKCHSIWKGSKDQKETRSKMAVMALLHLAIQGEKKANNIRIDNKKIITSTVKITEPEENKTTPPFVYPNMDLIH